MDVGESELTIHVSAPHGECACVLTCECVKDCVCVTISLWVGVWL